MQFSPAKNFTPSLYLRLGLGEVRPAEPGGVPHRRAVQPQRWLPGLLGLSLGQGRAPCWSPGLGLRVWRVPVFGMETKGETEGKLKQGKPYFHTSPHRSQVGGGSISVELVIWAGLSV